MKAFALVHPFLALRELWPAPRQTRESSTPAAPEPPKLPDEPGEPEREYPFWTFFVDNPRPKS